MSTTADESKDKRQPLVKPFHVLFALIWMGAGLSAILTSWVCVGRQGTFSQKFWGIALAFLFGPFYFVYLYLSKSYCRTDYLSSIPKVI